MTVEFARRFIRAYEQLRPDEQEAILEAVGGRADWGVEELSATAMGLFFGPVLVRGGKAAKMQCKRAPRVQWVASMSVTLMALCGYGLTGQYGFEWLPRWGFLLGLMVVFIIGGWGSWYFATHRKS